MQVVLVILSILLVLSLYFCFKFAIIILNVETAIEDSLDEIDQIYSRFTVIKNKPLFYDSPEIREVVRLLENARRTLLYIANKLDKSLKTESEETSETDSDG